MKEMPKLRNGNNGDSNPGSLDCESGILPTELPRSTCDVVDNTSLPYSAIVEWQYDPGTCLRISNIVIQFRPGTNLTHINYFHSIHC